MWLVAGFRRGLFATTFSSLAPTLFPVRPFCSFLSASVFLSLSVPLAYAGLGPWPAWTLSPGRSGARPTGSGCAAHLFGAPGTKLGSESDSFCLLDPARLPQTCLLPPSSSPGAGRREVAAVCAVGQLGL